MILIHLPFVHRRKMANLVQSPTSGPKQKEEKVKSVGKLNNWVLMLDGSYA